MKIDRTNTYISLGLAVALVGVAVGVGVTYGQVDTRLTQIEGEHKDQKDVKTKVQEIDKKQAVIIANQESQQEAQQKFEDSVTTSLDRIIMKLDKLEDNE